MDEDNPQPPEDETEGTDVHEDDDAEETETSPPASSEPFQPTPYLEPGDQSDDDSMHVGRMYGNWFLEYASYVILERAVPHVKDGLKPVQRRILHSMREKEDGRYNKVANVIGHTMQYHPHGDAAIGDAMVQIGQKDLLIDTQGNWGNILTGDNAAAPRYIEARLTPFALEVLFNPKTTEWAASYDGRNKEPITLPVKFPLLLAQGAEGIAVGLSTKILPHNFVELLEACIASLRKEAFTLIPDFPTGGLIDASDYHDGQRGGKVRVRARIEEVRKHIVKITEIPFSTTTTSLIESILAANDKGKIKIQKVDDNTAAEVEILVHLPPTIPAEDAIPALFKFTNCEVSISPNACVIVDEQPRFLSVSDLVNIAADQTRDLLRQELEIRLGELQDKWHFASLEKIFIEERIYRRIEKEETWEGVIKTVDEGLEPFKHLFHRSIVEDDILRLLEIRIKRISKYNSFKADELIRGYEEEMEEVERHLKSLTKYTIRYFKNLLEKYGKGKERKTEISEFGRIVAAQVATANETLYVNRKDGFAGWSLRKDTAIERCSRLDDVIIFKKEGTVNVTKIQDKFFVGKNPVHISIFRREEPKFYAMVYRDGETGKTMAKRFNMGGVTRDKDYEIIKNRKGCRIYFFAVYDSEEETEKIHVHLDPEARARVRVVEVDFASMPVKNRSALGATVTKYKVDRVARAPKEGGGGDEPADVDPDDTPSPDEDEDPSVSDDTTSPGEDEDPSVPDDTPSPGEDEDPSVHDDTPEGEDTEEADEKPSTPPPDPSPLKASPPPETKPSPSPDKPKIKKETIDFLQELLDFGGDD
jgi:topoisomerase-4 subunit A